MSKQSAQASAIDRYVGERLRTARVMRGLSQEKTGEALGVSFQQLQKYEKGVNRVAAGRLAELARILNVPVGWFYAGCDVAGDQPDPVSPLLAERGAVELLQHYAALDPKLRLALLGLARDLAAGEVRHREAA